MLIWPCDLIVASEDAQFQDNTLDMGISGVEYFAHPAELGLRKAKELLFTSDWLGAEEAKQLGMVNHVVAREELETATLALAERIARKPMFALRLAKEAVNTFEDARGRQAAMKNAFHLHQLCHSHNMQVHDLPIDPAYLKSGFGKSGS
jgi:enoyl-CoA hydratase